MNPDEPKLDPDSPFEHRQHRELLADALEAAAIALRDSELAARAAQKRYAEALQAFNQFVAPVPG